MKKQFVIAALLITSVLFAREYDYEITPLAGYNIAEGDLNLNNYPVLGAEFQINNVGMPVSSELTILYSNTDYTPNYGSTNIYRIALSGVYEYEKVSLLTPLVKVGLGYETMSNRQGAATGNEDSPFLNLGVGAKIKITDHLSLKLEAIYMLKNNSYRYDNNLAVTAGVNIAFGDVRAKQLSAQDSADTRIEVIK
ncbi:outer membrane beta-barrel protein [bacterium]|nr:outer membrane beta-barrel protein [bacterium]MBU1882933.1 outer membrane beta-barrel protein [bacterium]